MKKRTVCGLALLMLITSMLTLAFKIQTAGSSEPPTTEWSRTYGGDDKDSAISLVQTSDEGYALAGYTYSFGAGGRDFWLVKTDSDGNMQWNQTYGGTEEDSAESLVQTSDGGYLLAGYTESFGAGGRDAWVVKIDAGGNVQWEKTYGGRTDEVTYTIIQTVDGGYAIAGYTGYYDGPCDFWLCRTDSDGKMECTTYHNDYVDIAYTLIKTRDGGYALAGVTGPSGIYRDIWLVKTDSDLSIQWDRIIGYKGAGNEYAFSMIQTSDGGYVLAGLTYSSGAGWADTWLVKTDSDGNMQWNQTYGGTKYDNAQSLVATADRGYLLAGLTYSFGAGGRDFWLVKTDSDGNMQWNQTYGGTKYDRAFSVVQTIDGGYAVAGWTESYGAGSLDFWLIKLAPVEIPATLDIKPDTLNLKSRGEWITAYIELPEGYDVNDINVSTVLLNDTVRAESYPTSIGDYDDDGIPDLMVKFDRDEVISLIESNLNTRERVCTVTLTITGKLYDGTPFQGRDSIRVLIPRKGDPIPR